MKVLIIEDDRNKLKNLEQVLREDGRDIDLESCRSSQSGVEAAVTRQFDLLILDMSLPRFDVGPDEDGYEFDAFAGREILQEIARWERHLKTVVFTQFETFGEGDEITTLAELDSQLRREFDGDYLGAIYYSSSRSDWKKEIEAVLELLWSKS
jgi:CheY-like chemotaxis protein